MFRFLFTVVSNTKSGTWHDLISEYQKRLSPYAKIETHTITPISFKNRNERKIVLSKEAELINKTISEKAYTVLLTEHGRLYKTEDFTQSIHKWSEQQTRPIQFIVAGPLGIEPGLIKKTHDTLSLSPLTFPHDLAHVVLLEQLYRAMTIFHGKIYHY